MLFRSQGTGDVTISISAPVVEYLFSNLYPLAAEIKEFDMEITYYDGAGRSATGCYIDNFSFQCDAGEVAQINLSIVAKTVDDFSALPRSYTKGEKLLTWDKCNVEFPEDDLYLNNYVQSFTYNISNGIKSIKTADSLLPSALTKSIQDVNGQISLFDIAFPLTGSRENELGFSDLRFVIGSTTGVNSVLRHNVVFNPTQNIPLVPGPIVSVVTWTRSDDF